MTQVGTRPDRGSGYRSHGGCLSPERAVTVPPIIANVGTVPPSLREILRPALDGLVVRLRIDLAEGFAAALHFGDDVFGGGFPDEWLGVGVPVLGPGGDRGGEVADAGEDTAA